jgi:hypothetical protein
LTLHLKLATAQDEEDVLTLLKELHDYSIYSTVVGWEPVKTKQSFKQVIEGSLDTGGIVLLKDGSTAIGIIAFTYMLHMFNTDHKTAVELAFWVKPESRTIRAHRLLIGAYRDWARRTGCHSILMGKLKNKNEVESFTIRRL